MKEEQDQIMTTETLKELNELANQIEGFQKLAESVDDERSVAQALVSLLAYGEPSYPYAYKRFKPSRKSLEAALVILRADLAAQLKAAEAKLEAA